MSNFWEYLINNSGIGFILIVCCSILLYWTIYFIHSIFKKFFVTLMVRKHGWPPHYLDLDIEFPDYAKKTIKNYHEDEDEDEDEDFK